MTTVRTYSAQEILMRLCARLLRDVVMNASLGYPDASLPPLEVFERPGWTVVWATRGAYNVHIAILPEPIAGRCAARGDLDGPIEPEIEVVRPRVASEVELAHEPGAKRWFGLGFSVPLRRWVVFHG